jgi:hypothetical protein
VGEACRGVVCPAQKSCGRKPILVAAVISAAAFLAAGWVEKKARERYEQTAFRLEIIARMALSIAVPTTRFAMGRESSAAPTFARG